MLSRIVRAALHHPRLILAGCIVVLVYGGLLATREPLDAFPSLTPAQALVETEAPGMVAEQVEQLVTRPIENSLIGGRGLAGVHSQSIQGLSVVTLDFQSGADPNRVRQVIAQNLAQAATQLPSGIGAPRLSPLTSGAGGQVLKLGFTSDKLDPMTLRDLVQWTVRPRLLSAPGVAGVQIYGGQTRRIEVRARAGDLSDSDLGYPDVFEAVRHATSVTGAGFIDTPAQRVLIDPRGQALTTDDVAAGQIEIVGSAPVRISDVADVVEAPAPAFGDALVMGQPGIVVEVQAQYGANTLATTRAVEQAMAPLYAALGRQGVVVRGDLDRPAGFVGRDVREIVVELLIGAALAAVLLVLLLRDLRAALISILSLPLALISALAVFKLLGWSLNTMTLGGLAVALGLIVDDAVIDVEHILARLRDAEARHASRAHAVLMASVEIRTPVIYATLLVVLALAPILFLGGVQGALMRPLAVSIITASLTSLAVAVAVTPPLALLLLRHVGPAPEPSIVTRLKSGYDRLLARADRMAALVLVVVLLLVGVAGAVLATRKTEFLPTLHTDQLTAQIDAPASTAMAVLRAYGADLTQALLADADIRSVAVTIGRAETGGDFSGPEHAQLIIALKPGLSSRAQDAAADHVRRALAGYPGLRGTVSLGLAADPSGAEGAGKVRVRVFGDNLDDLDRAAKQVAAVLAATPGARQITAMSSQAAPVVRVDLNFQRLAIYGLSAASVMDTVQTAFAGRDAAQVFRDGRAVDIAVTAEEGLRQDPERVGELLLRSSSGVSAPLKSVANVYLSDGRTRIDHDGGLRSLTVLADPPNDVDGFVRQLRARIASSASLPAGTYAEVMPPEAGSGAPHQLLIDAVLAACAIIALLLVAFGDVRACLIVVASTLFALIGAALAILLDGGVFTLGALMGLFPLFGLAARNAALLMSGVEDRVLVAKAAWSAETVHGVAGERLAPLGFSALLIAVTLLPVALRAGMPGHEILGPMVFVILGGLVSSTLLNLLVLPLLVFRAWRPRSGTPVFAAES